MRVLPTHQIPQTVVYHAKRRDNETRRITVRRHHPHPVNVPEQFQRYACADYFAEGWAERGHFHDASQTLVIAPLAEAYEDTSAGFFAVGRSGADGIDFGYRLGHTGLWAYYPIEQDFKFMAPTVAELAEGWCSGTLTT